MPSARSRRATREATGGAPSVSSAPRYRRRLARVHRRARRRSPGASPARGSAEGLPQPGVRLGLPRPHAQCEPGLVPRAALRRPAARPASSPVVTDETPLDRYSRTRTRAVPYLWQDHHRKDTVGMGTRARAFRPLALATALAVLLAACGPSGPSGTSPTSGDGTPQQGGRIIEGSFSDIKTLQPILVSDNPSSGVTALLYDSLVYIEPKSGEIKPNLGKWTLSPDGLTYTWEIRADANWSDGKPVIAADFLTGVKAIAKSKKTVRKSSYTDVAGFSDYQSGKTEEISGIKIDSADPKKFTVTFTRVFCPALVNAFGSNYILPTQVFGKYVTATSKDEIDLAPENTDPKVVNGPFTFSEWRKGDQVILKRNDAYWDGAPYVDEYVYKVVADATVLAAQLKTGELNYGPVEPKDLADIDAQTHIKSYKWQQLNYTYIGWNVKSQTAPALQDKRVRQALAYGLDMDAVVRSVLLGQGTKQVAHHVPASWASPGAANLRSEERRVGEECSSTRGQVARKTSLKSVRNRQPR